MHVLYSTPYHTTSVPVDRWSPALLPCSTPSRPARRHASLAIVMALLSPALVVAMSVMFILTRLHHHFYIFERPLLFGLYYILEPDPSHLQALDRLTSSISSTASSTSTSTSTSATSSKISKLRPTAATLPLRITKLSAGFFPPDPQPYHREFSHLLSLLLATLAAAIFEAVLAFLFPHLLANSRAQHLAVFTLCYTLFHLAQISISLASARILLTLATMAAIPSALLVLSPSAAPLTHFAPSSANLRAVALHFFVHVLQFPSTTAASLATRLVIMLRLALAAIAAMFVACVAVPARRVSLLDVRLRTRLLADVTDEQVQEPYEPEPPSRMAAFIIAVEYAIGIATTLLPIVADMSRASRVILPILWVIVRLLAARSRMQAFLYEAVSAYRAFWPDRSTRGTTVAGATARKTVHGTTHFVFLVAVAYVGPAVGVAVIAAVAPKQGFVGEAATFLAWAGVAAYTLFAVLSVAVEALAKVADDAPERKSKVPVPSSGSERRRERRMMLRRQEEAARA